MTHRWGGGSDRKTGGGKWALGKAFGVEILWAGSLVTNHFAVCGDSFFFIFKDFSHMWDVKKHIREQQMAQSVGTGDFLSPELSLRERREAGTPGRGAELEGSLREKCN